MRFGRTLPPLARLHNERNALQRTADALRVQLAECAADAATLRGELQRRQEELDASNMERTTLRGDLRRLREEQARRQRDARRAISWNSTIPIRQRSESRIDRRAVIVAAGYSSRPISFR